MIILFRWIFYNYVKTSLYQVISTNYVFIYHSIKLNYYSVLLAKCGVIDFISHFVKFNHYIISSNLFIITLKYYFINLNQHIVVFMFHFIKLLYYSVLLARCFDIEFSFYFIVLIYYVIGLNRYVMLFIRKWSRFFNQMFSFGNDLGSST